MVNFIIEENPFKNFHKVLSENVTGFINSQEYIELTEDEKELSRVICAAFTRFFQRLVKKDNSGVLSNESIKDLNDSYNMIDLLSSSKHPEGKRLLVEGVFDNLEQDNKFLNQIYSKLTEKAKIEFNSWRENY